MIFFYHYLNYMKFEQLQEKIEKIPVFSFFDILKWFPQANQQTLKCQLYNWLKTKKIVSLKKGLYYFPKIPLNDIFFLAAKLYFPSYISLETALNYYGLMPDVPQQITSLSPLSTARFKTALGDFSFSKIQTQYFFGYNTIKEAGGIFFYNIARPEKALIDFLYLNSNHFQNIEDLKEQRFNFTIDFNWRQFIKIAAIFKQPKLKKLACMVQQFYA